MSLQLYRRKRRFDRTSEPDVAPRAAPEQRPVFVVQLHHARRRHYDFRLQVGAALKSWAVPKGPSYDPAIKRLALEVEDHPLAYAMFEGTIAEGNHGAGRVQVFDHGYWSTAADPESQIADGKLDFELFGERLKGAWTLVRTRSPDPRKPQWLLIKSRDEYAASVEADDLLGRPAPKPKPTHAAGRWSARALELAGARRATRFDMPPQLATLVDAAPAADEWLHEVKWDGYRLIARVDHGCVRLLTRNGLDWTPKFPDIAAAIGKLRLAQARFDGEAIVTDELGRSDFGALQRVLSGQGQGTMSYAVFDLTSLDGVDISRCTLLERKALLARVLAEPERHLAYSSHVVGHGARAFAEARRNQWEGIVSKRAAAPYSPGRNRDWLKVKTVLADEFLIVGYTEPGGARSGFGALLLARRDGAVWHYVGRVGTGFDAAQLQALHARLAKVGAATPAVELPRGARVRPADVHWVRPRYVAEIEYRGYGNEGLLRQPSFKGLRLDKSAADLERDARAAPAAAANAKRAARVAGARVKAATRARAGKAGRRARAAVVQATRRGPRAGAVPNLRITHPDRIVYRDTGMTKLEVVRYYAAVAPRLLPGIVRRPLSLLRCPAGVEGTCFFQKHHAGTLGAGVHAVTIREESGKREPYVYIEDLQGLMSLAQMNVLEIHPWGATIDRLEQPDRIVFDLDPHEHVAWREVIAAARLVRERLDALKLKSFVRLSGGKGLHVVVPLAPRAGWDEVKAFAQALARLLAQDQPQRFIASASKAQRRGRIFIDYLRNARGATSVCSYSLRARAGAPVAMPLRWEDLGRTRSGADFDAAKVLARLRRAGADPWAALARLEQTLPRRA